ncbi:MAG: hypothetical protein EOO17_02615 [Chloroflexi bacterium]|nr:MAG: hypothetical protein EOO17_02615 [Chloroflexota bacterium]
MSYDLPTDKIISCFYGSSQDCIKVVDTDGMLMSFNPNGLNVMEIDDESQVIGKEWINFWEGEFQQKAIDALATAKSGSLARFEGYCPTFKGTMKYWEVSIAPLHGEFGNVQWLLVMSHDATHLKELEAIVANQTAAISDLQARLAAV